LQESSYFPVLLKLILPLEVVVEITHRSTPIQTHIGPISVPTYCAGSAAAQCQKVFLFSPGWGCGKSIEYLPFVQALLRKSGGGTVYVLEYRQNTLRCSTSYLAKQFSPHLNLHPTQQLKAYLTRLIFEFLHAEAQSQRNLLTVIAYSEGAIHAVLALDQQLRLSKGLEKAGLILLNPAGLAPPAGLGEIIVRAVRNAKQKRGHLNSGIEDVQRAILAHDASVKIYKGYPGAGLWDGLNAGQVCVRAPASSVAKACRLMQVVTCENDAMINEPEIWKLIHEARPGEGNLASFVQLNEVEEADHFLIYTNPELLVNEMML
jgi:hypothetical protein